MSETATLTRTTAQTAEHFDVLIVGAGISGVGAAYHLTRQCPAKSFVVLESLESYGGTWSCAQTRAETSGRPSAQAGGPAA